MYGFMNQSQLLFFGKLFPLYMVLSALSSTIPWNVNQDKTRTPNLLYFPLRVNATTHKKKWFSVSNSWLWLTSLCFSVKFTFYNDAHSSYGFPNSFINITWTNITLEARSLATVSYMFHVSNDSLCPLCSLLVHTSYYFSTSVS